MEKFPRTSPKGVLSLVLAVSFFQWSAVFAEPAKFVAPDPVEEKPHREQSPVTNLFEFERPVAAVKEGNVFKFSVHSNSPRVEIDYVEGEFQGRKILFFHDAGKFTALVGVDYGSSPGETPIRLKIFTKKWTRSYKVGIAVESKEFPHEVLRVPPRTVEPTEKDKEKIAKDRLLVSKIYTRKTYKKLWDTPILPVDSLVTSQFGTFRIYNGKKLNPHLGTDLRAATGTPIQVPMTGKVRLARFLFYTGNTVILDHGYGLYSIYGHLSKLKVKEGKIAKRGTVLGLAGKTGRANGPHLHWGIQLNGTKVNPFSLVEVLKADIDDKVAHKD